MNKLAQIEAIDKGKGLQYLLDAAHDILQKPFVLFDLHYILLAYAGDVSEDPIWNALISKGIHDIESQRFFVEENFFENVANTDKHLIVKSSKLQYSRMMGYIFNCEHIKVAALVTYDMGTPFCDEDIQLFEKLTDILSDEIYDDEYYTEYGQAFHDEMIRKLLDGEIKDRMFYAPQIQVLYDGFAEYLYLAVVDTGAAADTVDAAAAEQYAAGAAVADTAGGDDIQNRILYIKKILREKYKSYKYAIYNGYIIIVMSSKYRVAFDELFVDRFYATFAQYDLYAGISNSFENPYEMRDSYEIAVDVLRKGKEANSERRVYLYQ